MIHLNRSRALSLLCTLTVATSGLVGCAIGGASFPDASTNPAQIPLGTLSGSDFGGHAPLVGAHVYVLQPSVTTAATAGDESNAYGYQATSLLHSGSTANGYTTTANASDPNIPTGTSAWYYETTDQTGAFNISGDYTCTQGLPVYLYLYGGSPTFPSGSTTASNTFNISNFIVSGSSGSYTVTMTINTTGTNNIENAYIGEGLSVASNTSANPASSTPFNGSFQIVTSPNLTTTTFSFTYASPTLPTGVVVGSNYAQTGTNMTVTFDPTFNPAVVNLAVLGNCPSSGSFSGANAISYVYVNEVSTVAAAYAFAPFTLPTNNDATHIGTSALNVAGIQNAAMIAKQLYDITGSKVSTSYAGEGHIANTTTVAGNGIIPQANLDTLGNIIAACVDSNNGATAVGTGGSYIYPGSGGYTGISPQCNTLFQTATNTSIPTTSTGTGANAPGTQPFDTAMAAINIARHPAGPPYSYTGSTGTSAFVTTLYTLPQGNRPFQPDLVSLGAGQPNDFTIAIDYTAANNPAGSSFGSGYLTTGAEGVAIDKIGNAWINAPNSETAPFYFFDFSPVGVVSNINYNASWHYGAPTVDSGESAWSGSATTTNPVTYVHATSTTAAASGSDPVTYTYNYTAGTQTTNATLPEYYTYAAVADYLGNVYFGNGQTSGSTTGYVETFSGAATTPTVAGTESAAITGVVNGSTVSFISGSIQPGGASAFFNYDAYNNGGRVTITSYNFGTGTNDTGFPVYGENNGSTTGATAGCTALLNGEKLVTTRSGDVIVPDFHNQTGSLNAATDSLYYINKGTGTAGTCTQISAASLNAGLYAPWAEALDGNDYVYIANRSGNSISVVNTQAGTAAGTIAVSTPTGYSPQYWNGTALTKMLGQPFGLATGPSGEIWVTSPGTNSVVEVIGLASPTTTPLSFASAAKTTSKGGIGYRP